MREVILVEVILALSYQILFDYPLFLAVHVGGLCLYSRDF
jgi:hypothetical protein